MELNTTSIADFTSLVRLEWLEGPKMVGENAKQLFITEDLGSFTGDSRRYTEIDTETYANEIEEGEDATIATVQQGYTIDMTMRRFAKEITITWKMRRLNRYPDVVARLTSLSHFTPQRKELDLTHRLTFAGDLTYTDLDGVSVAIDVGDDLALVSAAHTVRGSGTTYSNVITGNPAFSKGGLEAAELQANTQIISQYAERRVMDFNTIVTSNDPSTVNTVKEYLNSTADVTGAHSGIVNVYKNKYTHVVLPYLATTAAGAYDATKRRRWFLIAAGQGVRGWQAYIGIWEQPNLKTPAPGNNGEDVHNDNWTYGARCSYGIVCVTGRGLLMSTGAGA